MVLVINPVNCWNAKVRAKPISRQSHQEWWAASETNGYRPDRMMNRHERGAGRTSPDDIVRYSRETRRVQDKEPVCNCMIQDEIYIISPVDNPVASMSKSIRATGTLHGWTQDALKAAGSNALVEGADAVDIAPDAVVEKSNYTQIMGKVANVSGTLEEVDKYGRDSELSYQLELRYAELLH